MVVDSPQASAKICLDENFATLMRSDIRTVKNVIISDGCPSAGAASHRGLKHALMCSGYHHL